MSGIGDRIWDAVVYQLEPTGKVKVGRVKGSSISLPAIDEPKTLLNVQSLMSDMVSTLPVDQVLAELKESVCLVKSFYSQTHDGFRVARGTGKGRTITIGDLYSFGIAAGYCFDLLPSEKPDTDTRVGIGVMAPAIQDCGKNLVKLIWRSAGFDVVDLGNTIQPETWLKEISQQKLSLVGISCMSNRCIDNVHRFLWALVQHSLRLPVIIGGIAVNRVTAFNLTREYGIPIYYGQDVNDAVEVLEKALANSPVEVPEVKELKEIAIPTEISPVTDSHSFRLFKIRIPDIAIDRDARRGCFSCSGDKKRLCPLEIGYEKQKSIEESIQFIHSFKFAVLILAEIPNENHRSKCKSLWEGLLGVEQYFNSAFNSAHAFKFPMTCPFCLPKECKLQKGECMFPFLYRQLHEQYNINIFETLANVFGDAKPTGICSIILVR